MSTDASSNLPARQQLSDDVLRSIHNFDDAIQAMGGTVDLAQDHIGSGFELLEDKDQLVKKPIFLVMWDFYNGDYGPFVAVHVMTKSNEKVIINDGSSGIYAQLREYSERTGKFGGLLCEKGLTRSDYTYVDDRGEEKPARTYYLA